MEQKHKVKHDPGNSFSHIQTRRQTMIDATKIDSVETFLALSMLLEYESADRLHELASNMREHQADELAGLLTRLAEYSEMHASEIQQLSEGKVLPDLATLDLSWEGLEGPETTAYGSVNPKMSVPDLLEVARRNEIKGQDFYTNISLNSPNEAVRQLAADFANEENEHVAQLQQWIDGHPE
jgi:rubrerythrin